jgi:molybdopterin-binding protein
MNKIAATVTSVTNMEIVNYITVNIGETTISVIQSKVPKWLKVNDKVYITFLEFAVCVGKSCNGKVSIENRIPAVLKSAHMKSSLCISKFDTQIGEVVSLMPQSAFEELELCEGSKVTLLLSEMDIELEPYIDPVVLKTLSNSRIKVAS